MHTGLELICKAFQTGTEVKQNLSIHDKKLEMTVVNLLLIIFQSQRSDEGYYKTPHLQITGLEDVSFKYKKLLPS